MSRKTKKKAKGAASRPKSSSAKASRAKSSRAAKKLKASSAKKATHTPAAAKKVAQAKLRMTKEASKQDLVKAAAKLKSSPEALPAREIPAKVAAPIAAPVAKVARPAKPAPRLCRESGCESEPLAGDYCRVHYIRNWRKIKRKEVILKERKLNQYVEELINKYPEKYIEAIQQDLANDKDFSKVVHDLELNLAIEDEEGESESIDSLLDNIRKDIDVGGATVGVPVDEDEDLF